MSSFAVTAKHNRPRKSDNKRGKKETHPINDPLQLLLFSPHHSSIRPSGVTVVVMPLAKSILGLEKRLVAGRGNAVQAMLVTGQQERANRSTNHIEGVPAKRAWQCATNRKRQRYC